MSKRERRGGGQRREGKGDGEGKETQQRVKRPIFALKSF